MAKVLILRGRAGTWYEHSVASLHEFSHFEDCVYIVKVGTGIVGWEVREEDGLLIYTEAEYNEVVQQRDKMIDDLERHAQTIVDLQNEKLKIREKVLIPSDVAAGIEDCFKKWAGVPGSERHFLDVDQFSDISHVGSMLKRFAYSRPMDYMSAIVNGYTVEQSPEERLNNEIEGIILDWHEAPSGEVSVLTKRIVDHLKSIQT
ncbi:hypothetical protein [Paenibacillus brevis]|uniref:Uncharacterized protein n=1 Tax=Paenibacillus brevis TaxID=2841508 RepID=A0ABS6FR18_9BACL|nr:hypothetical protein [Paenibacillus brevis]MBU5672685.1 hypothetical protein [Paenibacillus brevis]